MTWYQIFTSMTFLNAHKSEEKKNCFFSKVPYIQAVQDRPSWQVNYHTSNQNEQYFSNANIPCQRLHPLQSWSFYDGQVLCEYALVKVMNSKLTVHNLYMWELAYLSFFKRTFLSDPCTIYSATVANVPPGPSGTTP